MHQSAPHHVANVWVDTTDIFYAPPRRNAPTPTASADLPNQTKPKTAALVTEPERSWYFATAWAVSMAMWSTGAGMSSTVEMTRFAQQYAPGWPPAGK